MPELANRPNYLTLAEVAEYTKLSRNWIYELRKSGSFPVPLRLGNGPSARLRWREADVIAWMESRTGDVFGTEGAPT